jgi:hypothetical protein
MMLVQSRQMLSRRISLLGVRISTGNDKGDKAIRTVDQCKSDVSNKRKERKEQVGEVEKNSFKILSLIKKSSIQVVNYYLLYL